MKTTQATEMTVNVQIIWGPENDWTESFTGSYDDICDQIDAKFEGRGRFVWMDGVSA